MCIMLNHTIPRVYNMSIMLNYIIPKVFNMSIMLNYMIQKVDNMIPILHHITLYVKHKGISLITVITVYFKIPAAYPPITTVC